MTSRHDPEGNTAASDCPQDSHVTAAPYERVGGEVSCVLTRFQLNTRLSLPLFYLHFRRVKADALAQISGLLAAAFLVENLRTCYTLSLWNDDQSLLEFSSRVTRHIHVASWSFRYTFARDLRRAELWSTQWRLWAVSHNLNWEGLDLRDVLARQTGRPARTIGVESWKQRAR